MLFKRCAITTAVSTRTFIHTSRTRILTKQSTRAPNLYPPDLIWIEDLWTRSAPGLWVQLSSQLASGVQHDIRTSALNMEVQ